MDDLTYDEVAAIVHQLRHGIGSRHRDSPVAKRMASALKKMEDKFAAMIKPT